MRDIYGDVTFHDPHRCHVAQHSGRNIFMKEALAVLSVALTSSPRTIKYPDNATLVHAARRYHGCALPCTVASALFFVITGPNSTSKWVAGYVKPVDAP